MKVTLFILLVGSALTKAGNDNAMERLLDDLLEDAEYDKLAIPMETGPNKETGENALNIAVGIGPRNMDVDSMGNLKMNAWLRSSWKDFRLMWEPEQYEGVDRIFLPADMVWRPDLTIYNSFDYANGGSDRSILSSPYNVVVNSDGVVYWIPAVHINVDCSREGFVPPGPADSVDCNIKLGSWVYDARHINLTNMAGDHLSMEDMSRNSPWVIESQEPDVIQSNKYDCCPEPYMSAQYRFKLKRAFHINENGQKEFDIEPQEIDDMVKKFKAQEVSWTSE